MLEIRASMALNHHRINHLSDLVQIHESYQIQWESRLNNAVALCRKEIWIAIVYVDFQIMHAQIVIYGELAWKIRWLNESVTFWDQSWISLDCRFVFNDSLRVEFSSIFWHLIIGYKFFCIAAALEILRQMSRQYPRFIQTYETFVHMNQSLCTSWCFIKSTKMQITWSWMNIQEWAPELERHRGSKFVWVQFYFHHIGMVPLQVCSEL